MKLHTTTIEVVMPTIHAGVMGLLVPMASTLREDVPRYMKQYKVDESYPAVVDKTIMAEELEAAIERINQRHKALWDEANRKGKS